MSGVASLPRIVTLQNIIIKHAGKDETLTMEAQATTYRYLEEDEIAAARKAKKANKRR